MAMLSALRTRTSSNGARAVFAYRKTVLPVSGNQ